MDSTLAQAAVVMLSPYFMTAGEEIAKEAGTALWEKAKSLYDLIQNKLTGDSFAQTALVRLEEKPLEENRQAALAAILTEKADEDMSFGETLTHLVQDLSEDKEMQQFVTNVSGSAQVGKIINIGRADSMTIN